MNGQKAKLNITKTQRKPFQGVINILSFNRHFYYIGVCLLLSILISSELFDISQKLQINLMVLVTMGLTLPLIASAWVYDFANYYHLNWLEKIINNANNKRVLNINAGFDETSFLINEKFPNLELHVLDFYNPKKHTEAAIKRARKVSQVFPNTNTVRTDYLPFTDNSVDYILFLSSLHEIRKKEERILFLKECNRVIKPNGKVIIVEHLRDIPNFLAFSVGFTHFHSKANWLDCFKSSNFNSIKEQKHTPFLSIFQLQKNDNPS